MKVVLINRSDQLGGAAIATLRLMHGFQALGVDARTFRKLVSLETRM